MTWGLAVIFLVVLTTAITRTRLLWAPTAFEHTRDMAQVMFAHTYQAARRMYSPQTTPPVRVALLGNSRIWLPAQEAYLRREIARVAPDRDLRIDNLAIFGARIGDTEVLSRHLTQLDPTLVVLALGGSDLVSRPGVPLHNVPSRLMRIGWGDGPVAPSGFAERVDRWARTAWRLYRFREFARAAIEDRIWPESDAGPFPEEFRTTREMFAYTQGTMGDAVERAYRTWYADPTLENFVAYLQLGSGGYLERIQGRVREGVNPTPGSPAVRMLEALLQRLAEGPWQAIILLMPENPLLGEDVAGRYNSPGFSDEAAALIQESAARYLSPSSTRAAGCHRPRSSTLIT
jgi:hypothetical protein